MTSLNYSYFGHMVTALIRKDEQLLLVEEQHSGASDTTWALPAGKVEQGEDIITALQRELREETGLRIVGIPQLVFVVQVLTETNEGIVEGCGFHFACDIAGDIYAQDPDTIVIGAQWFPEDEAVRRLEQLGWYDCTALKRWLSGEAVESVYTIHRKTN